VPKLLKSKPIQPLYTRGGTPIVDGFDPLGPGTPINTPFPTEIQNPNQIEPNQMVGGAGTVGIGRGRANAGPARTGAFGYGIRSRSFEQYNAPITDPRSQEPGAPISNRPIVPIGPGDGYRGQGGGGSRSPRPRDVSEAPAASNVGFRGAAISQPLGSVGVRASKVSGSAASTAGRVSAAPAKAAAPAVAKPAAAAPTTSTKTTKKTGKSGSLLRR
jgi:hypothetical protein